MASPSCSVRGEVADQRGLSVAKSSLPPPRPKSPPPYPDLYGKRREAARVQILEREIGFLEASWFGLCTVVLCLTLVIKLNSWKAYNRRLDAAKRSQNAATAHVAAALVPNAVTGPAAQTAVVVVVLVLTYVVAYPPVSAVAVDHRVLIRRRAHVAAAAARSNGHLVLNVLRYDFVVVFAIVKIHVLILVV
ncbi:hypothetical protein Bca52824_022826 [Brassica carinata]|uniref:Uncharacterized protein n=1 Tax=Brassica carinata TaxID=52824 RepID=A0A8X7VHE8_BRACI|nr:hypothetical protein Bca52824_022826 [Brassica carinata]